LQKFFLYLEQYPEVADWQAVVIFPRRSLEPTDTHLYNALLTSGKVQRFYLNELQDSEDLPLSLELLRLAVAPQKQAPQLAKRILATPSFSQNLSVEAIIDLVVTSMVYKFPNLNPLKAQPTLSINSAFPSKKLVKPVTGSCFSVNLTWFQIRLS